MGLTQTPMDWANDHFGLVELGDARRTKRAVKVGAAMLMNSSGSIPEQTVHWSATMGAYRLLNSPEATHPRLSQPHWDSVRCQARSMDAAVLFIQDQTELNYNGHLETRDLGFGTDGKGKALQVQSAVCVSGGSAAQVLGLGHQIVWTRDFEPRKKTEKQSERDQRHKESDIWADMIEAIGPASTDGPIWVSVGDRGSDVFSYIARSCALGWHCLLRARHNRRVLDSEGVSDLLFDHVRGLDALAHTDLHLRARPGQPSRDVRLNLSWEALAIQTPALRKGHPLQVWCIRAWEDDPNGLEWILLSTLAVASEKEALEKVEWYRRRWLVEEYHKCLKTGCSIESRQFQTRHALESVLGLLSIVAIFLLQLKFAEEGDLPLALKTAVSAISKRDMSQASPKEVLREIAKLGGFLARKGDGEPGWQTIWRGWTRLQDIMLGIQLAMESRCV